MIQIRRDLTSAALVPKLHRLFELSAAKIRSLEDSWQPSQGSPVCTADGRYASRGWTEWTQGFQFGSAILQFDATGDREFLEAGRERTVSVMAPHVTHTGVHDHGFNNVSTYGNLLRLMNEGRIPENTWERNFYELALKCSGAVQAARWSRTAEGGGYLYSFNGPHSLFVDTIRSARALVLSHQLGHVLMAENDRRISLFDQSEAIATFEKAARATCNFYIDNTPPEGIPYWDTGAPGLAKLGDWRAEPVDPIHGPEPVDSSAAAIGAQGLLRLGRRLCDERFWQAGLTVCNTLFDEPYLSTKPEHQGLILHSVYHRPNGWDAKPGESSMWGDYHARELALYLLRMAEGGPYLKFWL